MPVIVMALGCGVVSLQGAEVRFDLPSTGALHVRSVDLADSRGAVLLFLATDCPISNRYSPVLHQLELAYGAKGLRFFAVFSGTVAVTDAQKYLSEFSLDMPGLLDAHSTLARQTGAVVTPEAVVLSRLSRKGEVFYRGRIDDQYVDWGKTRPEATRHDLRDALDALLAGRAPTQSVTKALGCAISGLTN